MSKKAVILAITVIILAIGVVSLVIKTQNMDAVPTNNIPILQKIGDKAGQDSTTTTKTDITDAQKEAPKTMDTESYESCNASTECVAANLPSIDNPKIVVMQCLNSSILTDNPGFALSSKELSELATKATCGCEQSYCNFILK